MRLVVVTFVLAPLVALLAVPCASGAEQSVRVGDRAALIAAVAAARPGTTILIEPGTYRGGLAFRDLHGSAGAPIVLAAADPRHPPLFEGGTTGLQLVDPMFVELRDLSFRGSTANGLNIDDGGSFETLARGITLRRITVRDVGPNGNRDGIKLSGLTDFLVEDCVVERWGASGSGIDMVGCRDGLIVGSVLRHEDGRGSSGIQMKGGSRDIVVRRCRFENSGRRSVNIGGSTGLAYFRPRPEGFEARDITVEDCTFIGSNAPIAFVGVDGAIVRHNTIYRPGRWVLRILQETRDTAFVPSRNGRFTDNVIAYRTDELNSAVNVGEGTDPKSFVFSDNVWFAIDQPTASVQVKRALPTPEVSGRYGIDPHFEDAEKGDLRLQERSPARPAGARLPTADDNDAINEDD